MNLSSADNDFDEETASNASNNEEDGDNDYITVAERINNIDPQSNPDSYKFKIGTNAEPVDEIQLLTQSVNGTRLFELLRNYVYCLATEKTTGNTSRTYTEDYCNNVANKAHEIPRNFPLNTAFAEKVLSFFSDIDRNTMRPIGFIEFVDEGRKVPFDSWKKNHGYVDNDGVQIEARTESWATWHLWGQTITSTHKDAKSIINGTYNRNWKEVKNLKSGTNNTGLFAAIREFVYKAHVYPEQTKEYVNNKWSRQKVAQKKKASEPVWTEAEKGAI